MKRSLALFLIGVLAVAACARDRSSPLAPTADFTPADAAATVTPATPAGPMFLSTALSEPPLLLLTDKSDYQPGETVHVTGHGWKPGIEIQFLLEEDPATHDAVTFSVVPDMNGDFAWSDFVVEEHDRGVLFRLTATGDGQGGMAYFTDNGEAGTTLDAAKTVTAHSTRTFHWTIDKSVTPETLDLFRGDQGTSDYTIVVTKDDGTLAAYLDGQICVTNGGAVATENLAITDSVTMPPSKTVIASIVVDVSANAVLDPGEMHCYPYRVDIPAANIDPGHTYKNTAYITITNHSGHLGTPFGPSPSATAVLPTTPTLINDAINVDDTNGSSWQFSAGGSVTYSKTFTCDEGKGKHGNTATIRETGQSDGASVTVNCYALDVSKTAATALTRTYTWTIDKWATTALPPQDPVTALTLALNQTYVFNYHVQVSATPVDKDWKVSGTISVVNPAPIAATLTGVSDAVSDVGAGNVECKVTFPYTLPAGETLTCDYEATLPDASTRTNTGTATLQNTPTGTTDFTGTAAVDFTNATITEVDKQVTITDGDKVFGPYGPSTTTYLGTVGPYTTCGTYTVTNTATFETSDTHTTGSDSWTITVNVPCAGCSLTIGYWKTHAGFGPQPDMLSQWLPIWLGTAGASKSVQVTTPAQAVKILQYSDTASNGIFKLMGQLLGAKLNIANGADGSAISSVIAAADAFLATKSAAEWATLPRVKRNLVLTWVVALDNYNNGLTGPGHCSQ